MLFLKSHQRELVDGSSPAYKSRSTLVLEIPPTAGVDGSSPAYKEGTQPGLQNPAAGLSSSQAIHAGTAGAARILGAEKDLGTIEVGKWADLVFLDADPLADIRNTRRIWNVMQYGRLVDRAGVLKVMRPR